MYPSYAKRAGITGSILHRYGEKNYTNPRERAKAYVGDADFYCNVRFLSDAYAGKTLNLKYLGFHGADVLPTFYNTEVDLAFLSKGLSLPLKPGFGGFAQAYQSYLVSYARVGNPNIFRKTGGIPPTIEWPKADACKDNVNVLQASHEVFKLVDDGRTREEICDFWRHIAEKVTKDGGYEPRWYKEPAESMTGQRKAYYRRSTINA